MTWVLVSFCSFLLFTCDGGAQPAGQVLSWGDETRSGGSDVVAIAAGWDHNLALNRSGDIAIWGLILGLEPPVYPVGASNLVAISSWWQHSLGLCNDGTILIWSPLSGKAEPVPGLSNVVAISAGRALNLALTGDGAVQVVGGGTNTTTGLTNIVAIASGSGHLALKPDGTVVAWGWPWPELTNGIAQLTNVVAISAGYEEWLALKADGTVTGQGVYRVPSGLNNIHAVSSASGSDHHLSMALGQDGTVTAWGFNFYSQAYPGSPAQPAVPPGLSGVVAVTAGVGQNMALIGGGKPHIGFQPVGRTMVMNGTTYFHVHATGAFPLEYQWQHEGTNIAGATNATCVLAGLLPEQAGEYTVKVRNAYGSVTSKAALLDLIPLQIKQQPQARFLFVGASTVLQARVEGIEPLYYKWLHNGVTIAGATNRLLELQEVHLSDAGWYSVLITNIYGQILSEQAEVTVQPVLITSQPSDVISYEGGGASFNLEAAGVPPLSYQWFHNGIALPDENEPTLHLASLKREHSGKYTVRVSNGIGHVETTPALLHLPRVVAWGDLGHASVPPDLTNVYAIAAGYEHYAALKSDRTLAAWGTRWATEHTNTPSAATNVMAIFSGGYRSRTTALISGNELVVLGNGSPPPLMTTNLVAVSSAYETTLGLGADGAVESIGDTPPAQFPARLEDIVSLATGYNHGLALKSDGTVVAWGSGSPDSPPGGYNQGQATVPANLGPCVAIAAHYNNSMALRANGTVAVWGDNWKGQTNVPGGLTEVVRIACGEYHCMALKANGTVVVWGDNWKGQTNVPPGLTNVVAIAAAGRNCLALIGDGEPVLRVNVSDAQIADGEFSLRIPTQSGRVYRLEYKGEEGSWMPLPLVLGTGEALVLKDPYPSDRSRFYRVRDW